MSDAPTKPDVNTVSIEIDGHEMAVPKGSMIIEAADKVGINIPRFCYHKRLSIAANCRMCLVDVEKAPKPMPACATPVMDGMKVYTQSKRAVDAQRGIMEFLLINHPLDCPICDQGGECELQDVAMGYGRSVSRFTERKRVVADENLGPLVATEMTRCIHCTRCVRFLDEVAGTHELGGMGRGETTKISTYIGLSMSSELSGNIIDLCPVGALTNKVFRFEARAWELRSKETLANHDCVGSNLHAHTRRGAIERTVPRENDTVNESWLSDRDRYSHEGLQSDDRADEPQVRDGGDLKPVTWEVALAKAASVLRKDNPSEIGFLLSPRASTEELYLAQKIARGLGTQNVDHRLRERDFSDQASLPKSPAVDREITTLRNAKAVLLIGSNIRHDQPIIGHQVRQAWRAGATVDVVNVMDFSFAFETIEKAIVPPSKLPSSIERLGDERAEVVNRLSAAQDAVIIVGNDAQRSPHAARIRAAASALAAQTGASLVALPDQANSVGAWLAGAVPHRTAGGEAVETPGFTASDMLNGAAKSYLIYDFEPALDTAAGAAGSKALSAAAGVVYVGAYVTEEIRQIADVVLPLAAHPEADGTFINVNGAVQSVGAASKSPGDARSGWKILRVLGNALNLEGFDYVRIQQVRDELSTAIDGASCTPSAAPSHADVTSGNGDLELIARVPIYGCDGVVRRAKALQETVLGERAHIAINGADADRIGLADGANVRLNLGHGEMSLPLTVSHAVPVGAVYVPAGVPGSEGLSDATTVRVSAG